MGVVQYGTDLPRVVAIPNTSSLTRWASMSSFLILKKFATILYFCKEIIFNHIYYNWLMLARTELSSDFCKFDEIGILAIIQYVTPKWVASLKPWKNVVEKNLKRLTITAALIV